MSSDTQIAKRQTIVNVIQTMNVRGSHLQADLAVRALYGMISRQKDEDEVKSVIMEAAFYYIMGQDAKVVICMEHLATEQAQEVMDAHPELYTELSHYLAPKKGWLRFKKPFVSINITILRDCLIYVYLADRGDDLPEPNVLRARLFDLYLDLTYQRSLEEAQREIEISLKRLQDLHLSRPLDIYYKGQMNLIGVQPYSPELDDQQDSLILHHKIGVKPKEAQTPYPLGSHLNGQKD